MVKWSVWKTGMYSTLSTNQTDNEFSWPHQVQLTLQNDTESSSLSQVIEILLTEESGWTKLIPTKPCTEY